MNRQDFQRNFSNSYFGFRDLEVIKNSLTVSGIPPADIDLSPGFVFPCTAPVIDGGKILVKCVFRSRAAKTGIIYRIWLCPWADDVDENPNLFWTGVPRGQMVQLYDTCIYTRRISARDTPRGYCPRYTSHTLYGDELLSDERRLNASSYETVWNVYNPVSYDYHTAINMLNDGEMITCAIGTHVALGLMPGKKNIQIYYRSRGSVGYVSPNTRIPCLNREVCTYNVRELIYKLTGMVPTEV